MGNIKGVIYRLCPTCNGTGKVVEPPDGEHDCPRCGGRGEYVWGHTEKSK
jgi:DnaJ-class molecular chaperone